MPVVVYTQMHYYLIQNITPKKQSKTSKFTEMHERVSHTSTVVEDAFDVNSANYLIIIYLIY